MQGTGGSAHLLSGFSYYGFSYAYAYAAYAARPPHAVHR